ncbi:GTPase IMAP family member 1-like [Oopsacas minuta]|uniref:GTPase IMAP family member 1-like n=1 Tax=Oopsacas minuta TaxID=111878 RepID=A0AAV7JWU5_9METZ|nr:GTPase IMAP family member 1-like [Oopsacas minuta]
MANVFPDDEREVASDFYENPNQYNFKDCKYSLLIVGPCGAGKSAFCNFLLKEKRFAEATGLLTGTEEAAHCIIHCKDGDMLIVDCPGFCDPKRSHKEIMEEIGKAAILCRDGMDAIGIVIDPTTRFSETQKISYEQIELFGGEFWKHSFIIFTHEKKIQKKLQYNNASDYILQTLNDPKCPAEFAKLLNKVGKRFICVESSKRWNDEDYWGNIRDGVLAMVLQIKLNNEGSYVNCFMEHGKLTYDGLVGMCDEMRRQIDAMNKRIKEQDNHIWDLETERMKEIISYQASIDQITKQFVIKIQQYKDSIAKLNEKVHTKGRCIVM